MIGYINDRLDCRTNFDYQQRDGETSKVEPANNVKEVKTATPDQSDGERSVDADVSVEDARADQREEDIFPGYLHCKGAGRL